MMMPKVLWHTVNIAIVHMKILVRETSDMNKLTLSNKLAAEIITNHAEYDLEDGFYSLNVKKIPDFKMYELASLICQEYPDYGCEATGVDNPEFLSNMLPAMTKHLSDVTNKDFEIDFINAWRKGILSYCQCYINNLLEDALNDYNQKYDYVLNEKTLFDHYGLTANRALHI
jgi:hypothetical protein